MALDPPSWRIPETRTTILNEQTEIGSLSLEFLLASYSSTTSTSPKYKGLLPLKYVYEPEPLSEKSMV